MRNTYTFNCTDDVFDIRTVIDRYEALEDLDADADDTDADEIAERIAILAFLEDVCGNGGDAQWRGDWYPVTFIRDSYFETYAQELAEDIGAMDRTASWPNTCIDWEQAARELQHDYSSVEIDGVTYWYR